MCRDVPNNRARVRLQERLDQQFGGAFDFLHMTIEYMDCAFINLRDIAFGRSLPCLQGSEVLQPIGVGPDSSAEQSVILRDIQNHQTGSLLLDQLYNFGAPLTACIGLWNQSARNMGCAFIHFRYFSAL